MPASLLASKVVLCGASNSNINLVVCAFVSILLVFSIFYRVFRASDELNKRGWRQRNISCIGDEVHNATYNRRRRTELCKRETRIRLSNDSLVILIFSCVWNKWAGRHDDALKNANTRFVMLLERKKSTDLRYIAQQIGRLFSAMFCVHVCTQCVVYVKSMMKKNAFLQTHTYSSLLIACCDVSASVCVRERTVSYLTCITIKSMSVCGYV